MRRATFAPLLSVVLVLVLAPFATPAAAERTVDPAVKLLVSSADGELVEAPAYAAEPRRESFEVLPAKRRQTLAGWGGALNEKGWEMLQVLPPDARAQLLRRMFVAGEGLSLNFGRVPVGANDYALSRYSLAETPGDLSMEKFSIERDRKMIIPYARAAQALQPGMRFWASPWSPPPWMKDNGGFDSGRMKDDPEIFAAYALYLAKFVEAYRAEKIPVEAIAVQNEPQILTAYPSCQWDPPQFQTFIRDHLGPTLVKRNSGAKVILGTFNMPRDDGHVRAVLDDDKARSFVGILGLQWDGISVLGAARKRAPAVPVWHTETDCGNHHWERGFDPDKPQNDMDYAVMTWRAIRRYVAGGVEVYSLWNLVLDETGKSIDAKMPWPQNSPIVVDRQTKKVTYTPMFLAVQHWSRFSVPGSVVLEPCGIENGLAVVRPDGSAAVQLMNPGTAEATLRVQLGTKAWDTVLPARSFATMLIPPKMLISPQVP